MNAMNVKNAMNELQTTDTDWTDSKIDLIKRTVAKGSSDDEFALFLHACRRTGLDPLMKQIHAVKRWSATDGREIMSIQTGIDGYRLVADRTGAYAGSDDAVFEERDGKPVKATVTVWKMVAGQRVAFTATARWDEYCQRKKDGTPTSFWARMPYGQLAKCAESLALRKAFPAELSGLYTHEEMQQAENVPITRQATGGASLLARAVPPRPPQGSDGSAAPSKAEEEIVQEIVIESSDMTDAEWTAAITKIDDNDAWAEMKQRVKAKLGIADLRLVKPAERWSFLSQLIAHAAKQNVVMEL